MVSIIADLRTNALIIGSVMIIKAILKNDIHYLISLYSSIAL